MSFDKLRSAFGSRTQRLAETLPTSSFGRCTLQEKRNERREKQEVSVTKIIYRLLLVSDKNSSLSKKNRADSILQESALLGYIDATVLPTGASSSKLAMLTRGHVAPR